MVPLPLAPPHPHAALAVIGYISPRLSNQEATPEPEAGLRFPRKAAPSLSPFGASTPPCPSAVTQQEGATRLGRKGRAKSPPPGPRH